MKKKNTFRRNSLKLKKYKRRNSLKLKKSNRRRTLKRRNTLKLMKSNRRRNLKRRNSLKRRKMRGGFRTKDFWGESKNDDVFQILSRVGNNFSLNPHLPKAEDKSSTGKTLKFSRFMYGNPEAKIKEAEKNKIQASDILERAEKVLSDYQEQIRRGYYLETCVVREDDGDRAEGVLYLFIIDIPSLNIRYVMSFGFGDLAWGRTRLSASYPPDGKDGTWLDRTEWGNINGEKSAEKRMNMLKKSFMEKFQSPESIVDFASTINSNEEWSKRIGVYTIDISTEQSSVVSTPSTFQSSQQIQQGRVQSLASVAPQTSERSQVPRTRTTAPTSTALNRKEQQELRRLQAKEEIQLFEQMINLKHEVISRISFWNGRTLSSEDPYAADVKLPGLYGDETYWHVQEVNTHAPPSSIQLCWVFILFDLGFKEYITRIWCEYVNSQDPTQPPYQNYEGLDKQIKDLINALVITLLRETIAKCGKIKDYFLFPTLDLKYGFSRSDVPVAPIFKDLEGSPQYVVSEESNDYIKYMRLNALYQQPNPTVPNLEVLDQKQLDFILTRIYDLYNDDVSNSGYSYVEMTLENKSPIYLYILKPNILRADILEKMRTENGGELEAVFPFSYFSDVAILRSDKVDVATFIFPMFSRLLFVQRNSHGGMRSKYLIYVNGDSKLTFNSSSFPTDNFRYCKIDSKHCKLVLEDF